MTPDDEAAVLGLLYERCSEAVFTVDRDSLAIVATNARLEELTSRSRTTLIGSPLSSLLADPDADALAESIVARSGLHDEVPMRRIDGYPTCVELTVAHVEQGPRRLAACIARDTTERKLLERELIEKHTALHAAHGELSALVVRLTEQNQELEERRRDLANLSAEVGRATRRVLIGELSAGIAHSLNNPLAVLVSSQRQLAQALAAHAPRELTETLDRFIVRSRDALARMEHTIQAVRRAHRSGRASQHATTLVLDDELASALALFEDRLRGITVTLLVDPALTAHAPAGDLQHVLWNLVDNAILAMPGGGTMIIEVAARGDQAVILIGDSGSGVPPDIAERLFEPFVSSRHEGSGLGLSTARRLARDWNGDVRLAPSPAGATFEIILPREEQRSWNVSES